MEKIGLTDHVRNEEMLQRVKEERNIIGSTNNKKGTLVGFVTSCLGTAF
jgi:hypothetical protein